MIKKSDLIVLSDRLGLSRLVAGSPEHRLTTILYHHFFFGDEDREAARDRLKRECEWLRHTYAPVSAAAALESLGSGTSPRYPLLVTVDDAKVQLLDVIDIFESFELPLALFVCVGWTDRGSPIDEATALSRIVAELHWYEGSERTFDLDGRSLRIEPGANAHVIDVLIEMAGNGGQKSIAELAEALDRITARPSREVCNWDEIADLASIGVDMGSHSVSHAKLGRQSDRRLRFEITEAKKVLSRKVGSCPHFAYPYGDSGSFDKRSAAVLREVGHINAFVTKAGFASRESDPYELPRIVLPETPMTQAEFQARVRGGGIPLTALKQILS